MGNAMVVTEKDYPITKLWMFKPFIIAFVVNFITMIFGYWYPILVLWALIMLIANPLIRANFHYFLEDKMLVVRQGVLSKRHKSLPYGVIQHVFVKQDLFDRIFGLASLRIENAGQGAGKGRGGSFSLTLSNDKSDGVGAKGNKLNIPGLKKVSAEALKGLVLQKIKENPIEDSQSGL